MTKANVKLFIAVFFAGLVVVWVAVKITSIADDGLRVAAALFIATVMVWLGTVVRKAVRP